MKLLSLLAVSTFIVGSINAAILSDTQHITNELDRQISELYKTRSVNAGLSAAAEYFKAPQASKKNFKSKTKENFAATAEYFKAPDANELQSNALHLVRERLAPAAEYLKSPELPKLSTKTNVGNSLDAAAVYFKAPELPKHHQQVDRVAESLAATAEYLKVPEYPKRSSRTKAGNSLAAAAVYFRAPESPKLNIKNVRAARNLAAASRYPDIRRRIVALRRGTFGTTTKAPLRCYHRPGVI